jgi:hypothetical protein
VRAWIAFFRGLPLLAGFVGAMFVVLAAEKAQVVFVRLEGKAGRWADLTEDALERVTGVRP